MSEWIRVEREAHLAVLTLDRQERRNAMHAPVWAELRTAAAELAAEPPRVVVLTGAGGHFSAGMDLSPDNALLHRLLPSIHQGDESALHALIAELQASFDAFAALPVPVIAAVEGAAVGGGLEWALAADLIVAADGSVFSLPETGYGMIPDVGGCTRLARRVGVHRAADMILSGRRVHVDEAERWGLVDRRVPRGQALSAARALALQIAKGSPAATRAALSVLRELEDAAPSLARERAAGSRALLSGEVLEGVAAFAAKRAPEWAP